MRTVDLLAETIAKAILDGFERHFDIFQKATMQAKSYFEQDNWEEIQSIAKQRIYFYEERVKESRNILKSEYNLEDFDEHLWLQIKQAYVRLTTYCQQPELAETFFNSIFCGLFDRQYYNNQFIFVRPSISIDYIDINDPITRSYCIDNNSLSKTFASILTAFDFKCGYLDFERDVERLCTQFYKDLNFDLDKPLEVQIIQTLFFRNRAVYIIGKVISQQGIQPLCMVLLQDKNKQLYVDALLMHQNLLSSIFSFTRAYFLVSSRMPGAIVSFLKDLLPNKTHADLYSSIGFHKHAKTLLYRMFLRHTKKTNEMLKLAPGIHGMVMLVFTFPVYPYVFKLMRDKFKAPKNISRQTVKDKYRIVKNHDRVGRLADTWEFSKVAFPLNKIDPNLLQELKQEANSNIKFDKDLLVIKHLYIEQKMCPLNLYLQTATIEQIEYIINDYGKAIKALIHANIFPGDMLLKNFGVTNQNRVVFYDYDEILTMDKVNFRAIPEPQTIEQEMSSSPWYKVANNDVFPEEFINFLFGNKQMKEFFLQNHADLLEPNYWKGVQQKVAKGDINNVIPYPLDCRMEFIYQK